MQELRLKTGQDIAGIWRAGQVAGKLLEELRYRLQPDLETRELDRLAAEYIAQHGATATFLGYRGYPASICTSINDEVVHGIPGERRLKPGDLVSLDVGVTLKDYIADTAVTWQVPGGAEPSDGLTRLCNGTSRSLLAGIRAFKRGVPLRMVSRAVQTELDAHRLKVIRELTGHGVGFQLHEEPTVYNYDPGVRRPLIQDGMVIAIEPMASLGTERILLGADNWTYRTADGSLSAHYEHTVACWEGQTWVLTDPSDAAAGAKFGAGL